jgi:hypothetical protein
VARSPAKNVSLVPACPAPNPTGIGVWRARKTEGPQLRLGERRTETIEGVVHCRDGRCTFL